MKAEIRPAEQNIEALQKWFGPNWTWTEIALWIEARSQSSGIPLFAKHWSIEFLEKRREQEKAWKD